VDVDEILSTLRALARPERLDGMAGYGVNTSRAFGVAIPELRQLAKKLCDIQPRGSRHALACELWGSGFHEARILASMIDEPARVTEDQMEAWVAAFDSWDLCDQCCANLFEKTGMAYAKAQAWSLRPEEFVKRAGFVLMARLAVSDKLAPAGKFEQFFPAIFRERDDDRNFVKKAVNWALRQIGKRNISLNAKAVALAEEMIEAGSPAARWIASDALRELTSAPVRQRLANKKT